MRYVSITNGSRNTASAIKEHDNDNQGKKQLKSRKKRKNYFEKMKKVPRKFWICLHAYIKSPYLIVLLKVTKFSAYTKPTQSLHKVYIPKAS